VRNYETSRRGEIKVMERQRSEPGELTWGKGSGRKWIEEGMQGKVEEDRRKSVLEASYIHMVMWLREEICLDIELALASQVFVMYGHCISDVLAMDLIKSESAR